MKTLEHVECVQPATLPEALSALADAGAPYRILAGGTDLIVQWQSGAIPMPERVLDLSRIGQLDGIREENGTVIIGARATHGQIRRDPLVQRRLPALAAACSTVGSIQIQNRGTLAGNVANASPAGDTHPALLITGGEVVVASVSGERRIPLTTFFLDYRKIDLRPDELIVRFELPGLPEGGREFFHKLGARGAQAISKVMGACRINLAGRRIGDVRVALGSVAATCIRLRALEEWLVGRELTPEVIDEAEKMTSSAVRPIADIRSTAPYRKWVSGRLIRGFLERIP